MLTLRADARPVPVVDLGLRKPIPQRLKVAPERRADRCQGPRSSDRVPSCIDRQPDCSPPKFRRAFFSSR